MQPGDENFQDWIPIYLRMKSNLLKLHNTLQSKEGAVSVEIAIELAADARLLALQIRLQSETCTL